MTDVVVRCRTCHQPLTNASGAWLHVSPMSKEHFPEPNPTDLAVRRERLRREMSGAD